MTKPLSVFTVAVLTFVWLAVRVLAQQPAPEPSYAKQVAPILRKHCVSCHKPKRNPSDPEPKGGLLLDSYANLMKGGKSGTVIVPGKSADSLLVKMIEGTEKPRMPYQLDPLPKPLIETIKRWIDAGAKLDFEIPMTKSQTPNLKPKVAVKAQIASVAFHPSRPLLAAGTYREVLLFELRRGGIWGKLRGHVGVVNAVAFSPDGKLLAAAGGLPKQFGEIRLWEMTMGNGKRKIQNAKRKLQNANSSFRLVRTLRWHSDAIYSIAFSPDGKLLAAASYDQLISLWHITNHQSRITNHEPRFLKDHTDAVYAIAFSPDGTLLASASGDRTVKVWEVATGKRLYTLSEPTAELYAVSFSPDGKQLAAAGVDKMLRTWNVSATGGALTRSAFAHEGAILRLLYAPDGNSIITAGEDGLVKVWDKDALIEQKVFEKQPDWALTLALSPDAKWLAVGRYDGSLSLYEVASGKRWRDLLTGTALVKAAMQNKTRK